MKKHSSLFTQRRSPCEPHSVQVSIGFPISLALIFGSLREGPALRDKYNLQLLLHRASFKVQPPTSPCNCPVSHNVPGLLLGFLGLGLALRPTQSPLSSSQPWLFFRPPSPKPGLSHSCPPPGLYTISSSVTRGGVMGMLGKHPQLLLSGERAQKQHLLSLLS